MKGQKHLSTRRPSKRLAARGQAKREQILRGALSMFATHGYTATSMDRVATAAGVSKPTLYGHFQNKDNLFSELCAWIATHRWQWQPPPPGEPKAEWLEALFSGWLAAAREPDNLFLLQAAAAASERFTELGDLYLRTAVEPLYAAVLAAIRREAMADPEASALVASTAMLAYIIFCEIMHGTEVVPISDKQFTRRFSQRLLASAAPAFPPFASPGELVRPPTRSGAAADRREQILADIMAVFLQHGFHGTSMDMAAAGAGISKPTLYSLFEDKQTLFCELIARVTVRRSLLIPAVAPPDPSPLLLYRQAWAILIKADDPEYLGLLRLILAEALRFPELPRLYMRTVIPEGLRMIGSYLSSSQLTSLPAEEMVVLFMGSLIGHVIFEALLGGMPRIAVERQRFVLALLHLLLGNQEAPESVI